MEIPEIPLSRIREKLRLAQRSDPEFKVFGAADHRYVVHPPASAKAIRSFEEEYSTTLPDAYKMFLLHIGNGGVGFEGSAAGPFYGIYPLGQGVRDIPVDDPRQVLVSPCVVSPAMSQQAWSTLVADLGLESDLSDEAYEIAVGALLGGLLPIGSQGCSYVHCLVLNGPFTGRIANVDLDRGQPPRFAYETDFLAWYERWLDEVISGELGQNPSWFGYVKGGPEAQLLAEFQATENAGIGEDCLSGLLFKRRLTDTTLLELARLYYSRVEYRSTICQIICKSNYTMAKPLLADIGQSDLLSFFQCLHWHARDKIAEWQDTILNSIERIEDEETFKFFTYVLEPLCVDRGAYLTPFARSELATIRAQALYALGKVEDRERYLTHFIAGLNDADNSVIRLALQALAGVQAPSLLPHYRRLVERFPVERDYVLMNLDRRLAEFGLTRASLR
jgi:hypothetical protein